MSKLFQQKLLNHLIFFLEVPPLSFLTADKVLDNEACLPSVPIHIVTKASQLPEEFLNPSPEKEVVIGFDCEGADLCRQGTLCIMQVLALIF